MYQNIGYFFKIEENNNKLNIENLQNYENNKFILDILSFLISLYLFENEIINKIKNLLKKLFLMIRFQKLMLWIFVTY